MNFEAQILKLRGAANEHAAEAKIHHSDAAIDREKAAELLKSIERSERAAIASERIADDFNLIADALASGTLTPGLLAEHSRRASADGFTAAAVNEPTEYYDAQEAAHVREIERELDRWAGDDSEIDHQVALDDARNERRALAAHDAHACPGCPLCTGYDTDAYHVQEADL